MDGANTKAGSKSKRSGGLGETIKTIIYAGLIAIGVRTFAYEPFNIPSKSMVPTLLVGDYLFVSKFSYGYSRYSLPFGLPLIGGRIFFHPPERGDVVVFKLPADNTTDYIKRVIGLPGDRIQMVNGRLVINGKELPRRRVGEYVDTDEYGNATTYTKYMEMLPNGREHVIIEKSDNGMLDNTPVYTVPPGHYFCMGDNRDNSLDSRVLNMVGYVPEKNLVGRAEVLFFSSNGTAHLWEVWKWPTAIRFSRLFTGIH